MKHFTYNCTWNLLLHTILGRPKRNVIHCASTYIAASCLIGNQRVVNCVSFHKELHEFLFWLINAKILGQTWVEFGRKDRQKRKLGSAKSSVWTNAERERERERKRLTHERIKTWVRWPSLARFYQLLRFSFFLCRILLNSFSAFDKRFLILYREFGE